MYFVYLPMCVATYFSDTRNRMPTYSIRIHQSLDYEEIENIENGSHSFSSQQPHHSGSNFI